MSSLTNINNNSSVINVGRTTPVSPGPQPASQSIPVVVASDQAPIPVIEQQKVQSEVALSMLGIPRSEVALGIFSDVNTYDVNPAEWSESPTEYTPGWGIRHLPQEAGAIVQAPKDKIAILSSKRFFRYQPGRVSSATFGVKSSETPRPDLTNEEYDLNPAIRKYGIFDKFDGYYWETRGDSKGDNFVVVRRTQSILDLNPIEFSDQTTNQDDYRIAGKAAADPSPEPNQEPRALNIIGDAFYEIVEDAYEQAVLEFDPESISREHLENFRDKCERDAIFALNAYMLDIQYGGRGHTITNATTYRTAIGPTDTSAGADDRRAAEEELHNQLGEKLKSVLSSLPSLNGSAVTVETRIDQLTSITKAAVTGTQPSQSDRTSTSSIIWPRNKFRTIFSIYKRYLGYLISEAFIPDVGGSQNYTTEDFKYKCLRDVGYIADGYGRDLAGGGNSATVYNMKNFYFNNVLQVVSDFAAGYDVVQFHIHAHTLLRSLISKNGDIASGDNPNATRWDITNLIGFTSVFNYFGLQSTKTRFDNELATPIINNFTIPYSGRMDKGAESQFGDLIVLRDGLIHIHAAVYDPSLLKETKRVRVRVNSSTNTLEVSRGEFVVDQVINYIGDAGGLNSDKFYSVKSVSGPLSNIITLYDPRDPLKQEIEITSNGSDSFIEPNAPFIFPDTYQKGTVRRVGDQTDSLNEPWRKYDGMFPYMYASASGNLSDNFEDKDENGNTKFESLPVDNNLNNLYVVGFINTAIDTNTSSYEELRAQIDQVNFRYNNWIKQNVDPRYYAVYEYRVPRSYFSTDKLDGETRNLIYSDVSIGETPQGISKVRPGQTVVSGGVPVNSTSVWDIDLTKVTMLKVDFSWYGAVGALFFAYVPVSNGEARWVRVHHLRASNQLKISSLGNATLPITYVTYGGGSVEKMGIEDMTDKSYGATSDHVVKYGASYYIDGGDRGTVRLYSHTNLLPTSVTGRTYEIGTVTQQFDNTVGQWYFEIPSMIGPANKTFFMKSQVVTSNIQDQNVEVVWIDGNKIYLSKSLVSISDVKLVSKRPSITFGLKAKDSIFNSEGTGIRNRVQVYPTKLSTANFANVPMSVDIIKTPIFQTNVDTSGSISLTSLYTITSENNALPVNNNGYLENDGDEVYGWFIANVGTVFGRLYKVGGSIFFETKDVFTQTVTLFQDIPFLKDGRFSFDGSSVSGPFEASTQKERLSSVFISNVNQTPIPDTGNIITSFFLSPGADQFDLLSFFDYNKDYLSFPLTDELESIYLSASLSGLNTTSGQINTSITWEEQ
jgi:hypothetical protein